MQLFLFDTVSDYRHLFNTYCSSETKLEHLKNNIGRHKFDGVEMVDEYVWECYLFANTSEVRYGG